jgi:hypothetical protein
MFADGAMNQDEERAMHRKQALTLVECPVHPTPNHHQ